MRNGFYRSLASLSRPRKRFHADLIRKIVSGIVRSSVTGTLSQTPFKPNQNPRISNTGTSNSAPRNSEMKNASRECSIAASAAVPAKLPPMKRNAGKYQ